MQNDKIGRRCVSFAARKVKFRIFLPKAQTIEMTDIPKNVHVLPPEHDKIDKLAAKNLPSTICIVWFDSENRNGQCFGYIQGDPSKTTKGLIIIQAWWGITDYMLEEGKAFAEKGPFVTLVPDLYRGKKTDDFETAGHYMDTLDWPGAIQDVIGGAKYLLAIGCTKVGVTGFCMGGALSLAVATKVSEEEIPVISASAPFYGIPQPGLGDLGTIKIPVQCHFGAEDDVIGLSSSEDQEKLKRIFDKGNVKYEFHQYEGAGHAFMDYESQYTKFNKSSREEAVPRLISFMNKALS